MTRLQRRNDTLGTRKQLEGVEAFLVIRIGELNTTLIVVIGMLGADGGVIQARGDGMGPFNLPFAVL